MEKEVTNYANAKIDFFWCCLVLLDFLLCLQYFDRDCRMLHKKRYLTLSNFKKLILKSCFQKLFYQYWWFFSFNKFFLKAVRKFIFMINPKCSNFYDFVNSLLEINYFWLIFLVAISFFINFFCSFSQKRRLIEFIKHHVFIVI